MDDSKHKAKTEATEGERPQSTDKAVGTEASLRMTAEAFASSVLNRLTGGTKDDLITSELKNAGLKRPGTENGVSSAFIHNSDEHRLSNSGEVTTTIPTFADRLGTRPSEGQQALFNAVKTDSNKNTEVPGKSGTIEVTATASAGAMAMAKAETPAKAPVDERSLIAAGRSDVQVTQTQTNTSPSLLDQLNNCEVKRGACTVEEAKQNGFNIESMKTASQTAAAEQQVRKSETPSLIEQLSQGNNKVGPCTIEEAKQNGFKIDAAVQVSTNDQINRASKSDALNVPKDESSKVERSTGSNGPSLIEQLQSGNSKVGPCTVEEARQNGFQIGSRNTEVKPEDGQKLQDRFDGLRVEPSFKIDSSKLDPAIRTDLGLRTSEVQKNVAAADMRSNNQTEKSTGLLDQLNGYNGKPGACSIDEAKQNGSLPTGRVDFAAKSNEPARVDFKSSELKAPEIRADFKSSDSKNSEGPHLADFSTKAPDGRPAVADFRPQVGSDQAAKVELPQFKTADPGKDVATRDLGFRDTTAGGRVDLAARTENNAALNSASRTEQASSSRDFSREQSAGRERESSTLAGSSRDVRDFADVRQSDRTIAASNNVERTSFNTIDLGKAQSAQEPARVASVEPSQLVRSEAGKVALDTDDHRARPVDLSIPLQNVASADKSVQNVIGAGRELTLPSFARISTGSEIDPTTGKAIALNTLAATDKVNLIAVEKNIAAMLGISNTERTAFSLSEKPLATSIMADKLAVTSTSVAGLSDRVLLVGEKTAAVTAAGLQERGNLNGQLNIEAGKVIVRAEDGTIIARKDASMATLTEKGIVSSELVNGKTQFNLDTVNGGKHLADTLLANHKSNELPAGKMNIEKVDGVLVDAKGRPVDIHGQVLTNKVDTQGVVGISNAELAQLEYEDGVDENGLPIRRIREFGADKNKRYLTGVELTIAAVIAMGGAAKVRNELMLVDPETGEQIGTVAPNLDAHKILHRRTHMVSEGETLQSIAESLYQNQAIAWLIADLNGANIREENIDGKRIVELKSRQVLELPEAEEITTFLNTLQRDFNIDNLVTVVSETTIDRELLDSYLGTVSGGTEAEQSSTNSSTQKPAKAHKPEKMRLPELIIGGLFGNHQDMPVANASRIRNNQQDIPSSAAARVRANQQDMPIAAGAPLRANQQDIPLAVGIPARNNHQDMPVAAGVPTRANHQDMPIKAGITGVVKDLSSKIGRLVKRPISNKLRPV